MRCLLLEIEFAEKNLSKELGVFLDEADQRYSFRPQKYEPIKQGFWCTRNLHGIVWNRECLDHIEVPIFFLEVQILNFWQKKKQKTQVFWHING